MKQVKIKKLKKDWNKQHHMIALNELGKKVNEIIAYINKEKRND